MAGFDAVKATYSSHDHERYTHILVALYCYANVSKTLSDLAFSHHTEVTRNLILGERAASNTQRTNSRTLADLVRDITRLR